jgi:CRISPR-associated protein Csb2
MFALALRYLNGWAMAAADGARKETPEWPPHPDRVFMALAAAWFETDQNAAEAAALRWLEAQAPPAINASGCEFRRTVVSYVPVNDARLGRKVPDSYELGKLRDAGLAVLPEHRSRQARSFPIAIPHDPCIHLIWPAADAGEHRPALERLAGKLTHVGHSASFVQAWIEDVPPTPTLMPMEGVGPHRLRVPVPGRLDALERTCNRTAVIVHADLAAARQAAKGKERARLQQELDARFPEGPPVSARPTPARWMGYAKPALAADSTAPQSLFDPRLVVLRLRGQRLDLPATLRLTEALRGAVLAACPEPIPHWVSGHTADGAASREPHLAFLPLPFVGASNADGHLLGVAIATPATIDPAEVAAALDRLLWSPAHADPRQIHLFAGRWFECTAQLEQSEVPPLALRPETWTAPARRWGSVTPVVLDRHGDGPRRWAQAEEVVKDACERIGLPRPAVVALRPVSAVTGVPHARAFPPLRRKNGDTRQHLHAEVLFDEPVRGPLLIGAGRFRGYGLLRPLAEDEAHD